MKQIVVVGSLNADLVQTIPRAPRPGETILGGDIQVIPGGKGANQAVAAGRLGVNVSVPVSMIGEIGGDRFGELLTESLQSAGVDQSRVGRSAGATGTACILVLPNGENLIVVSPAANSRISADMVRARLDQVSAECILLCQLEIPLGATALALVTAHGGGAITILDPAPAQALDRELLSTVTYLTPNQTEAALLLRDDRPIETWSDAEAAARRLIAMGPANVAIKLGSQGCLIAGKGYCHRIPGFAVKALDTTAAGDVFNGAFAVGLAEGLVVREAGLFANAAAAVSVTRFGAQSSIPTRQEVDAFLAAG